MKPADLHVNDGPPLACNLNAIPTAEHARYRGLLQRTRAALWAQTELPNGYTYRLDLSSISLPEIAEWITLERLCCPFLRFRLDIEMDGISELTLRGPKGVKAILQEHFPTLDGNV